MTVPSLLRGMFMHTRRCTAKQHLSPQVTQQAGSPQTHCLSWPQALHHSCSTIARGSDSPGPSQLNQSKGWAEPGEITHRGMGTMGENHGIMELFRSEKDL